MVTQDTAKLFVRNAGLVWRIMLYIIICLFIIGGLGIALCYPFVENLVTNGVFDDIFALFTSNVANVEVTQLFVSVADIFRQIFEIIAANWTNFLPIAIILFLITNVLGGFLLGLSEMAVADCLYCYMGSNTKIGFMNCFVKNIVKSIKLQLAKLAVVLPFNIIILTSVLACFLLFSVGNFWLSFFTPFIIILVFSLLFALKNTIFCSWVPSIVAKNWGIWYALKESVRDVAKNFGKIYGRQFVLVIGMVALVIASIILTASVALVLVVPAIVLFLSIMNMVIYFYINGLKFYVDTDEIITSKKREDWENINSLKDVI